MLPKVAYGLEIGSRSAKVVKITYSGGKVILDKAVQIPFPEGDQSSGIWRDQAASLLKGALAETQFKVPHAALGVSGRDAIMRYSRIPPVQPWRLNLIMKYQVEEMAGKQGQEVTSDYRILSLPRSHLDEFVVLVAMARSEFVESLVGIADEAGITLSSACPNPVALYNSFVTLVEGEEDKTYFLADIGRDNTDVALVNNGDLYFARTVSLGGDEFTKALAQEMELSEEVAEKVKIEEGLIRIDGHATKREERISDVLMSVAAQFSNMVTSTVKFAKMQTKLQDLSIDKVVLSGAASQLPGLTDYLSTSIGVDVELLNVAANLKARTAPEGFSHRLVELACPLGLAVAGLDKKTVSMDILPEKVKKERDFKEKTRYMYVSGVLAIMFIVTVFALSFYTAGAVETTRNNLREANNQLADREQRNEELKNRNLEMENAITSLIRETEPGNFYTHCLLLLKKMAPGDLTLEQVEMDWSSPTRIARGRRGEKSLRIEAKGTLRASSGREYEMLKNFKKKLEQDEEISRILVASEESPNTGLEFIFTIFPAKEIKSAGYLGK